MTRAELDARGIDAPDVVFVTGDAYVDHPSFAMAILGRWLEAHGFRVAILAQPDWQSAEAWRALGRPRLFYGVSAGNMDSMINHYTANRKRRNDDAYSPGRAHRPAPRPADRRLRQRCREAFPGVPVIAGGVEASLRRIAHYDYWSDTVRPSILVSSKGDLLVYGMGERAILEIAGGSRAGEDVKAPARPARRRLPARARTRRRPADAVELPSFEDGRPRARPRACAAFARRHAHDPPRDEPAQRPAARPAPRRPRRRGEPARAAARRARDGRGLRPALHAHAASRVPRGDPRRRDDPRLGHDHARLLRGLHVLLDHHAPGPRDPSRSRGLGAARGEGAGRSARLQGHGQRPRRPDGEHVPDALHEARGRGRSAGASPASTRRSASCSAPTTAPHRPDAQGARRRGRQARATSPPASAWISPAVDPSTSTSWPRTTSAAT